MSLPSSHGEMDPQSQLDRLYETWQKLGPASSDAAFDELSDFFDESCTALLRSMREWDEPVIGRKAIVAEVKAIVEFQQIDQRHVLSRLTSDDERTAMCEMKNHLRVAGKPLKNFHETVIASFNEVGKITNFRTYSCRSPIVAIVQTVTGGGPYTKNGARVEFERTELRNQRESDATQENSATSVESTCC